MQMTAAPEAGTSANSGPHSPTRRGSGLHHHRHHGQHRDAQAFPLLLEDMKKEFETKLASEKQLADSRFAITGRELTANLNELRKELLRQRERHLQFSSWQKEAGSRFSEIEESLTSRFGTQLIAATQAMDERHGELSGAVQDLRERLAQTERIAAWADAQVALLKQQLKKESRTTPPTDTPKGREPGSSAAMLSPSSPTLIATASPSSLSRTRAPGGASPKALMAKTPSARHS